MVNLRNNIGTQFLCSGAYQLIDEVLDTYGKEEVYDLDGMEVYRDAAIYISNKVAEGYNIVNSKDKWHTFLLQQSRSNIASRISQIEEDFPSVKSPQELTEIMKNLHPDITYKNVPVMAAVIVVLVKPSVKLLCDSNLIDALKFIWDIVHTEINYDDYTDFITLDPNNSVIRYNANEFKDRHKYFMHKRIVLPDIVGKEKLTEGVFGQVLKQAIACFPREEVKSIKELLW